MTFDRSASSVASQLSPPDDSATTDDVNLQVSGLLQDLAHIFKDHPKHTAYHRAAGVVAGLDRPISELVFDDHLEKLPGIGRSIEKVVVEYIRNGRSDIVERAFASASRDRQESLLKRRAVRENFLSIARAREVLWGPSTSPGTGPSTSPGARAGKPIVTMADYKGDLQQHSLWSDGSETIEQVAEHSVRLGQQYAALTDHFGLAIANGLNVEEFYAQHVEIDGVNAHYGGRFALLKGVEANIQEDGTIDLPADAARMMDIVVASPHSLLRREQDQTARMVSAVRQPGVHILGHPRGRKFNDRPGIKADWDEVFRAAAAIRVAVEIDGSWERQDIDYTMAARALELGCLFALNSDAHYRRERDFSGIAVAHARLAGIPAERVVNCWPLERLLEWSVERKA